MTFGHSTVEQVLRNASLTQPLPPALASVNVAGLEYDSRRAAPGVLFFAFPGSRVDGRAFAMDALQRGAIAVVSELESPEGFDGPWIRVAHGRQAMAAAAKSFYGAPDEILQVTGITGTNGKTTTSYLLDQILRSAGRKLPAVNTTPDSVDLFRIFRELVDLGGTHAVMETSSHALELGRVHGLRYHTAVFTNLTQDHLDFHGTMEAYFQSKCKLFESPSYAVINHDDAYGRRIQTSAQTYWYGIEAGAAYRAQKISSSFDGLRFEIQGPDCAYPVVSPMVGQINVYNILAAFCSGLSLGLDASDVLRGIAECAAVPGRFERISQGQPFLVAVDYAHTSDALRNVIAVARGLNPKRVITLFGCGGDRDRAKRPLMGAAAAEDSDFVVITSDNPRSEDPLAIINDAMVGVSKFDTPHVTEPDRFSAIRRALAEAKPGDIVILAGKGHEPYQILRDRTIAFDDRAVARQVLAEMGFKA